MLINSNWLGHIELFSIADTVQFEMETTVESLVDNNQLYAFA